MAGRDAQSYTGKNRVVESSTYFAISSQELVDVSNGSMKLLECA